MGADMECDVVGDMPYAVARTLTWPICFQATNYGRYYCLDPLVISVGPNNPLNSTVSLNLSPLFINTFQPNNKNT